jgi:hypothetical protein
VKRLIFTIDGLAITLLSLSLPFLRQEILGSIPLVYMPSRRVEIVHSYTGEHLFLVARSHFDWPITKKRKP